MAAFNERRGTRETGCFTISENLCGKLAGFNFDHLGRRTVRDRLVLGVVDRGVRGEENASDRLPLGSCSILDCAVRYRTLLRDPGEGRRW
jgi:hypothetical protein